MKIILFGAGSMAKKILDYINSTSEHIVVAVTDNKWKEITDNLTESLKNGIKGHLAILPEKICEYSFDRIIITLDDCCSGNDEKILQIYDQLKELGVPEDMIVLQNYKYIVESNMSYLSRMRFIKDFADFVYEKGIKGAIAECGVLRGHISAWMNNIFFDRKIYLFDTFEFWDERDMVKEPDKVIDHLKHVKIQAQQEMRVLANETMAVLRCPNRELVTVRKGYIPDSFSGVDEQFVFVNLDMDIYAPQLAALQYFAGRMAKGGVILLHDYFHAVHTGTKRAIEEFGKEYRFSLLPIGESSSVALIMK